MAASARHVTEDDTGMKVLLGQKGAHSAEGDDCAIDVVAIHGLGMHPDDAWCKTAENASGSQETINWLIHGTMLPMLVPKARIMRYGYESHWFGDSAGHHKVTALARRFLVALKRERTACSVRPIIFIAHCFGGLILIKALLDAVDDLTYWPGIFQSTAGIIFLGTPFRGTDFINQHEMLEAACFGNPCNLMHKDASKVYEIGNEFLQHVVDRFSAVKAGIHVHCFWELKSTQIPSQVQDIKHAFVVSETSGCLDLDARTGKYSLNRDHFNMTRFSNPEDEDFQTLGDIIKELAARAPDEVLARTNGLRGLPNRLPEESFGVYSEIMQGYLRTLRSCGKCHEKIPEASERTLSWIWDDPDVKVWMRTGEDQLWVTGKPGSGKSVLMRELSHNLVRHLKDRKQNVIACHFFNDRGKLTERSFRGMLQCILSQILDEVPGVLTLLATELQEVFGQGRRSENPWTLRSLQTALKTIIAETLNGIDLFLFADGLDECDRPASALYTFFRELLTLAQTSGGCRLHICCSTRQLTDGIHVRSIAVHERNAKDILGFVNQEWALAIPDEEEGEELTKVKDMIIERADGVFLWVQFVVEKLSQGLRDGNNMSEISGSLETLPSQLSGLYDTMLKTIKEEYKDEMLALLSIVLCAAQPLSLPELRLALALCGCNSACDFEDRRAVEKSDSFIKTDATLIKRLRSRCGGLIEISIPPEKDISSKDADTERVVQFMHQSVKDHFLSPTRGLDSRLIGSRELLALGHRYLTVATINYLMLKDLEHALSDIGALYGKDQPHGRKLLADTFPFLDYSITNWTHHYYESEQLGDPQWSLLDKFRNLDAAPWGNWCAFRRWQISQGEHPDCAFLTKAGNVNVNRVLLFERENQEPSHLAVAVRYRFLDYVRRRLLAGDDANEGCLLQLAAANNHLEMVELLIEHGIHLELMCFDVSALLIACMAGHDDVVRKLLDMGASTMQQGDIHPLAAAALSGRGSVIELLLTHDPETFMNGSIRFDAFQVILTSNLIRRAAADPDEGDIDDDFGFDETSVSTDWGQSTEKAVDLLTAAGIDLEIFGYLLPWLLWFLTTGRERITDLLLSRDIDFSLPDEEGVTFFLIASFAGSEAPFRSLVDHDRRLAFATSAIESTALHTAAANPDTDAKILQYFLTCVPELEVNALNVFEISPLHVAAEHGSDAHVEALVEFGANVLLPDREGRYPLHLAVANRKITNTSGILDALCPPGLSINVETAARLTPLMLAARSGSHTTVQWLLDKGAIVEARDPDGRTALHAAAANESDASGAILELLILNGLETSATDETGTTPLHCVLTPESIRYSILRPIFSMIERSRIDPVTTWLKNLRPTIPPGAELKIQKLLSNGANVNAQDYDGNTILHWACAKSRPELVKYLVVRCGANTGIEDDRGCRPIDLARVEAIRTMLEAVET